MSNQGAVTTGICAVCHFPLTVRWTDTHGIGACVTCGLPYRVYHYDGDRRVEKPPTVTILEGFLPLAQEYWETEHRPVFPGAHCIGFERDGRTYAGHTREEIEAFDAWMQARKDRWPVQPEATSTV